ncbi:MAG: hypothetical protein GEU95_27430 [Rhizobiales bacterium]|nr:hypothetical protein [Hyphomicrobiales bacterium]
MISLIVVCSWLGAKTSAAPGSAEKAFPSSARTGQGGVRQLGSQESGVRAPHLARGGHQQSVAQEFFTADHDGHLKSRSGILLV